jgi:hypothetical protein
MHDVDGIWHEPRATEKKELTELRIGRDDSRDRAIVETVVDSNVEYRGR